MAGTVKTGKQKLYINGRFLTQRVTGVQRYAIEITKAIDALVTEGELTGIAIELLTPKNARTLALQHIPQNRVGHLTGHLWEQLDLPRYARGGFLLNLCNCAPVFQRHQAVTIHDAAVFRMPSSFSFLFRTLYRWMHGIERYTCNPIFTVSNFSRKELAECLDIDPERIVVTPNGADHIKCAPAPTKKKSREPYVLAVSSLKPLKNFALVIRAAKRLPDTNFFIVGGKDPRVFAAVDEEHGDNIHFLGYVDDEALRELYANASVFVYPSLYEGFGIPPIEAMAMGCPVIVTKKASLPEVCGDAALYCDATNDRDLAAKIRTVMKNDVVRQKLVARGRERVKTYRWIDSAKTLLHAIQMIHGA